MQPKRTKYDTNPLDEDVAHRADESFGRNGSGSTTEDLSGQTKPINRNDPQTARAPNEGEAPTRRIDDKVTSYPSVFVPPQARATVSYEAPRVAPSDIYQPPPGPSPGIYQPPGLAAFASGRRNVAGLGIPECWAAILPYMPFSSWLGVVIGVIELFLTPRTETRVRFHASQALALQVAISALTTLLTFVGLIFRTRFSGAGLVGVAGFVFLWIAIAKVWKGKPFVISVLEEPRRWLDEKIKPRR
jgi:uncharacterized membrane protein